MKGVQRRGGQRRRVAARCRGASSSSSRCGGGRTPPHRAVAARPLAVGGTATVVDTAAAAAPPTTKQHPAQARQCRADDHPRGGGGGHGQVAGALGQARQRAAAAAAAASGGPTGQRAATALQARVERLQFAQQRGRRGAAAATARVAQHHAHVRHVARRGPQQPAVGGERSVRQLEGLQRGRDGLRVAAPARELQQLGAVQAAGVARRRGRQAQPAVVEAGQHHPRRRVQWLQPARGAREQVECVGRRHGGWAARPQRVGQRHQRSLGGGRCRGGGVCGTATTTAAISRSPATTAVKPLPAVGEQQRRVLAPLAA